MSGVSGRELFGDLWSRARCGGQRPGRDPWLAATAGCLELVVESCWKTASRGREAVEAKADVRLSGTRVVAVVVVGRGPGGRGEGHGSLLCLSQSAGPLHTTARLDIYPAVVKILGIVPSSGPRCVQ